MVCEPGWSIRKIRRGFEVSHVQPGGMRIVSFPYIKRWWAKSLYPWAICNAIRVVRRYRDEV